MMQRHFRSVMVAVSALAGAAFDAQAWGPVAQRAIVGTAFQAISRGYSNPFKTTEVNYEADVIAGALSGRAILEAGSHIRTDRDAINQIGTEIQLLRDAKRMGSGGSYFAFRMGVLASLVSDVVFPLTFADDPTGQRLRQQVESDVDKNLESFQIRSRNQRLQYMRYPAQYFTERRAKFAHARTIIEADYASGRGYNGYMREAGPALVHVSVEAVADAWFTVLRVEGDPSDVKPSSRSLSEYFCDQVVYLLREKRNYREAEKVYRQFAAMDSPILAQYERIGDAFYEFGTRESRDRGVQEWTGALSKTGPERGRLMNKLSAHYLEVGKAYLQLARRPKAPMDALPNALQNFTKALEYNRGSEEAASLINETQIAIAERDERLRVAIQTVAAAESVVKQAESSQVQDLNVEAISLLKKAISLYSTVGDEFEEQSNAAREGEDTSRRAINRIIGKVLEQAADKIDEGDRLVEDKRFDDAMNQYRAVDTLLKPLPEDVITGPQQQEKVTLVAQAEQKVLDAEKAKRAQEAADASRGAAAGSP